MAITHGPLAATVAGDRITVTHRGHPIAVLLVERTTQTLVVCEDGSRWDRGGHDRTANVGIRAWRTAYARPFVDGDVEAVAREPLRRALATAGESLDRYTRRVDELRGQLAMAERVAAEGAAERDEAERAYVAAGGVVS